MNKSVTTTAAGTQPIPGYTLRKRLGAGGYGEVWLADAPGGLQKAVKLIFGSIEDSRATNELRSLERVRSAHHPFILSLERIEIVQGKLIIVTELAESSLQDRFERNRRAGAPGIPRKELLEYLRDSADALDFLAEKHSLQHLDVKPGNLLIIADHVKVADFGLVKNLQDSNNSLVSGLTPTYSAPEVFDGRPDFKSDQYSLAIVFMEMLTGRLPFTGRTAGELARQHLTQAPNLDPLPPADRVIVQRALSKNPLDRYATCRQFVDQLLKVRNAVVPVMEVTDRPKSGEDTPSSPRNSNLVTETRNCNTSRKLSFANAIPLKQFSNEWNMPRAMFIGIGGQGVLALQELHSDLSLNVDHRLTCDDYGWLALDTARDELETVLEGDSSRRLPVDSIALLPIQPPQSYRKYDSELFTPLSRRWLYNIPRSLSTEGVRPIATLALIANYPALFNLLESRLRSLMTRHQADGDCHSPLRVYVTGSLHGGTGSALLAEMGFIVRRIFAQHGFNNYRLCAVVSAATVANNPASANLKAANAIVTLSELNHLMKQSMEKPSLDYRNGMSTSNACPFDWVSLVDGGSLEDQKATAQNPKRLARAISLDIQTLASAALAPCRLSWRQKDLGWLRTVRCESIKYKAAISSETLAKQCCADVVKAFMNYLTTNSEITSEEEKNRASIDVSYSANYLPLTTVAIDKLIQRTLGDMRLTFDAAFVQEFKEAWTARLSSATSEWQLQMAKDVEQWQRWISHHVQVRVYSWRQVERIQLELIRGLLNYISNQVAPTLEKLKTLDSQFMTKPNLQEAAKSYLNDLAKTCVHFMGIVRNEGTKYGAQLKNWLQSPLLKTENCQLEYGAGDASLKPLSQQVYSIMRTQLEDRIGSRLTIIPRSALKQVGLPSRPGESTIASLDLPESEADLLDWARQLMMQISKEMGLNPDDLDSNPYHHSTINLKELKEIVPAIAEGGGEILRMVVANQEQIPQLQDALREMGIKDTTTLVPGTPSLGTQVICDAVNLNLSQIVSTLWRPSGAAFSLAERLRTRVDIEWEDSSSLLNWKFSDMANDQQAENASAVQQNSQPAPSISPLVSLADAKSDNIAVG